MGGLVSSEKPSAMSPAAKGFFDEEFITAYTTMRRYELSRHADRVSDWERTESLELF